MSLAPPRRPLTCTNPDCGFPAGGRCARAAEVADPAAGCPDLLREAPGPAPSPTRLGLAQDLLQRFQKFQDSLSAPPPLPTTPWTGRHLDPVEAQRMMWRSPARLIAVLGNLGTGKTCLLTSFFLQLATGQRGPFGYRFAGSQTLQGLNDLCERAASWDGSTAGQIVDATPQFETDAPRLFLHLALCPQAPDDDRRVDMLLTDIPGEWVKDWTERQDEAATRRLGFLDRCDGLLVLTDAGALAGNERGRTDSATGLMLRRVTDRLLTRRRPPPVGLVFSKFDRIVDQVVPPENDEDRPEDWGPLSKAGRTWAAARDARERGLNLRTFAVSAFPDPLATRQPVGVMAPFAWLMARADARAPWPDPEPSPVSPDATSFQTLRRHREAT